MARSATRIISQSVVDVESGLIVHHDVCNDANDSHMLHPVSVAAKKVLEVDKTQVLTDGGYSNAEEIARREREGIEVVAPIKRGAFTAVARRHRMRIVPSGMNPHPGVSSSPSPAYCPGRCATMPFAATGDTG